MSVRFDTDNEGFTRTTSLLNYNSVYSWCAWIYMITDRDAFTTLLSINDGAVSNYDHLGTFEDGTTFRLGTGGVGDANGSALSLNTWYHVAMVREASNSLKAYLNGVLDITVTDDVGTSRAAVARNEISMFTGLTRYFGGRVAGIKMWDAALTLGEIQQEKLTVLPRRLSNLNAWYPVFAGAVERALDYSGNGRDWTQSGTLTDEDAPPVPWGAAQSKANQAILHSKLQGLVR